MDVRTTVCLSTSEEEFVLSLARGLRPTKAAAAAGYAPSTARPLLHRPHISAAIRAVAANLMDAVRRIDAGK